MHQLRKSTRLAKKNAESEKMEDSVLKEIKKEQMVDEKAVSKDPIEEEKEEEKKPSTPKTKTKEPKKTVLSAIVPPAPRVPLLTNSQKCRQFAKDVNVFLLIFFWMSQVFKVIYMELPYAMILYAIQLASSVFTVFYAARKVRPTFILINAIIDVGLLAYMLHAGMYGIRLLKYAEIIPFYASAIVTVLMVLTMKK